MNTLSRVGLSLKLLIYHIASNYGQGIYFFPVIFNQPTKQDRKLLSEEICTVYNL